MSERTYTFRFGGGEMISESTDGLMDDHDIANIVLWACREAKPHAPRAALAELTSMVAHVLNREVEDDE